MIVPYTQKPYPSFTTMQFVVRSRSSAAQLMPAIQRAIAAADPTVPISNVHTIEELVGETSSTARFAARVMSAFGLGSLALAMIGLYGVVAYGVHQRRQEFGVRRALGASPRDLIGLVLRETALLVAMGLGAGIVVALGASRAIAHLLYGISPGDPIAFLGTVALLAVAAAAACWVPARRAARVEPRVALEDG
jgi:ABC-type antimicrobial peptide transport system permease subunit